VPGGRVIPRLRVRALSFIAQRFNGGAPDAFISSDFWVSHDSAAHDAASI
jgi:hypothetical protein